MNNLIINPCVNSVCNANVEGDCGKPVDIPDDIVCERGRADKMIPHYNVNVACVHITLYKHFYIGRTGFVTLQNGQLIYLPGIKTINLKLGGNMQRGYGYSHDEIAQLIKDDAVKRAKCKSEDLSVKLNSYQGYISASVTHKDGKTHLWNISDGPLTKKKNNGMESFVGNIHVGGNLLSKDEQGSIMSELEIFMEKHKIDKIDICWSKFNDTD